VTRYQLVTETDRPETWQDSALCREVDPEMFFPEKGERPTDPRRVCFACQVRAECLEYALANGERYGIWGGTTETQRRRLRREPTEVAA
jgi:WhiB family redox-sensing transcriptional regulator